MPDYGILSDNVAFRYGTGALDEIFSETFIMDRLFFLSADIVMPANDSVAISVGQNKMGSFDFYGTRSGDNRIYGYDILTQPGNGLIFDEISAGITGIGNIVIDRQNFGFDPENGVLYVTLDPELPHYYVEVLGDS